MVTGHFGTRTLWYQDTLGPC